MTVSEKYAGSNNLLARGLMISLRPPEGADVPFRTFEPDMLETNL